MFTLSELLRPSSDRYRAYLARKTGFVVSGDSQQVLAGLWGHLLRTFDFDSQWSQLTSQEQKALYQLLYHFGHLPESAALSSLEEKIAWIFRHPQGGIFIPLEFFKALMKIRLLAADSFLFSLLYRLKNSETRDLASLLAGSAEAQFSITFEKNPLDMALVLYVWFSGQQRLGVDLESIVLPRGKILPSPYVFIREKTENTSQPSADFFPAKPVAMWEHLHRAFPSLRSDIDHWYNLMEKGGKGFYRSLGLLPGPNNRLVQAFKKGYFFPTGQAAAVSDMKIVTPAELYFYWQQTMPRIKNSADLF